MLLVPNKNKKCQQLTKQTYKTFCVKTIQKSINYYHTKLSINFLKKNHIQLNASIELHIMHIAKSDLPYIY